MSKFTAVQWVHLEVILLDSLEGFYMDEEVLEAIKEAKADCKYEY